MEAVAWRMFLASEPITLRKPVLVWQGEGESHPPDRQIPDSDGRVCGLITVNSPCDCN